MSKGKSAREFQGVSEAQGVKKVRHQTINTMPLPTRLLLSGLLVTGLSACGGGGGGSDDTDSDTPASNTVPVANAGINQTIDLGDTASLSGLNSSDADGDTLTYQWSLLSGPTGSSASLASATNANANANLTPDLAGTYQVSLVVNDSQDSSAADTLQVTVNTQPLADAGSNQNVTEGDEVLLSGINSTDADGDELTYQWQFSSMPSGSSAALSSANSESPSFTAYLEGSYTLSLVVNDSRLDSLSDAITVIASAPSISNVAPVANAGDDQNVTEGESVTLSGSSSTDSDGDSLTYQWRFTTKPTGSRAKMNSNTNVSPSFTADVEGTYTLSLVVNDGQQNSVSDSVSVIATAPINNAPVANAGADQSVSIGDNVVLSAASSSDVDGDTLTYQWLFTALPIGSSATLNSATSASPTFTADLDGTYTLSLVVNDGQEDSASDSVTITALTDNNAPLAQAGNDRISYTGGSITLDGGLSSDADSDSLTYSWVLEEKPASSVAVLSNASTVSPSLTTDLAGSYVVALTVNDGTESSAVDKALINTADWSVNNDERSSFIDEGGLGVLVNVQSVSSAVEGSDDVIAFTATGIPNYTVTMTQDDVDSLNNRPKASDDFKGNRGKTTASAGDVIEFGQDIGYSIPRVGCELGYWPPGPACPTNQSVSNSVPAEPSPATATCSTGLNSIGVMLNGTAIFNWGDGQSYNNAGVWTNLAPVFEFYDVDICLGHAQTSGNYHHHMFSKCLQDFMDDEGDGHSPIYGFAADGYPIHGPYQADGLLAKPSWVERDYEDINSLSGCGVSGERSCQLVDQYDLSQGVTNVTSGPDTSDTVTSMSENDIDVPSGVYFEDFFHDSSLSSAGDEYLDEHNGHNHDNLGYHYHITVEDNAGVLEAIFPYQVGPTFYGEVPSDGIASCR